MGAFKLTKQLAHRAIEYDLFLLIDPTNHIKSLGEQASRFVQLEHGY